MSEKRFITAEQAINILPDRDEIHTFINNGFSLFGADWDRKDIIDKINHSEVREIAGETARGMKHGLVLYDKSAQSQKDLLFVETDKDRLDAFDPEGAEK